MSTKDDYEKKHFEVSVLKEFSARTKLTQTNAMKICRQHAGQILTMYSDGYTAQDTAKHICSLINVDEIRSSNHCGDEGPRWR